MTRKKNSYYLSFNNTKHFQLFYFFFSPNSIINFKVTNPNIFQPFKILQHKNNRKWIRLIILAFVIFNVGIVEPSSAPHNFISSCVFVIMKLSGVNFYKTRDSCKKKNVIYMEKSINMNNIYSINTILYLWPGRVILNVKKHSRPLYLVRYNDFKFSHIEKYVFLTVVSFVFLA